MIMVLGSQDEMAQSIKITCVHYTSSTRLDVESLREPVPVLYCESGGNTAKDIFKRVILNLLELYSIYRVGSLK
jgi:hypothetical protein